MVKNKKKNNQDQKTLHFENAIYSVLHERSNNTVPFAEDLKFQKPIDFLQMPFGVIVAN